MGMPTLSASALTFLKVECSIAAEPSFKIQIKARAGQRRGRPDLFDGDLLEALGFVQSRAAFGDFFLSGFRQLR